MATNRRILSLALEALYLERQKLDSEIADIQRQLGKGRREATRPVGRRSSRRLSAAGRKAISDAMTKRWSQYRRRKESQKA